MFFHPTYSNIRTAIKQNERKREKSESEVERNKERKRGRERKERKREESRERETDRVRESRNLDSIHCRTFFDVFVEQFSFPAKNYFLPFAEEEEASTPRQIERACHVTRSHFDSNFCFNIFRIRLSLNLTVLVKVYLSCNLPFTVHCIMFLYYLP